MKRTTVFMAFALSFGINMCVSAQHVWKNVSAGDATTYAIRDDGTLWTCGWNEKGQLGVPEVSERTATFNCVGTDKDWKTVAGGKAYAFLIKDDGSLWAVGTSESGVQGTGDGIDHKEVVRVGTDNDWQYAAACRFWGYTGFAIKTDGTLWGWGNNTSYQLGLGNTQGQVTPVQIGTDNDWVMVSAGEAHVIALKKDGSLWGWGNNVNGSLGLDNSESSRHKYPERIGTDNDWVYISAISQRSYAVKSDGTLWATGDNFNNILGLNQSDENFESVINEWRQITAISEKVISVSGCEVTTTVAVGENGVISKIYAWGSNADGGLGDGKGKVFGGDDIPFETSPVVPLLPEGLQYTTLTSGQSYSIVITADGNMYGWGRNKGGQLGDDTEYDLLQTSYYKKPFEIACPQGEVSGISDVESVNAVCFDGNTVFAVEGVGNMRIYSATGALVKSNKNFVDSWDISDLQRGIYVLVFDMDGRQYMQKIMKR